MAFFNLQHTHRHMASVADKKKTGIAVKNGEVRRINGNFHPLSFTCRKGAVWLTQEGDLQDHILYAGAVIVLDTPMEVVVQGLEDSGLEVTRLDR